MSKLTFPLPLGERVRVRGNRQYQQTFFNRLVMSPQSFTPTAPSPKRLWRVGDLLPPPCLRRSGYAQAGLKGEGCACFSLLSRGVFHNFFDNIGNDLMAFYVCAILYHMSKFLTSSPKIEPNPNFKNNHPKKCHVKI